MTPLGKLPEFRKERVGKPIINSLSEMAPSVVEEFRSLLETSDPQVQVGSIIGLSAKITGGVSTQAPGAVATVNIPHGFEIAPSGFTAQPANANARGAPAFHLTADATNIVLNFAANLTAATSYAWVWTAVL